MTVSISIRIARVVCGVAVFLQAAVVFGLASANPSPSDIEVFTRSGCPHCAHAEDFLATLAREHPGLRIFVRDVGTDEAALERLRQLARDRGRAAVGVPSFFVGGTLVVGYAGDETTGRQIEELLGMSDGRAEQVIHLPFAGEVSATSIGLPLFTVTLGVLDGFNPCAMWVLLFVLSLLVNLKDRTKMLAIGGTFVLVSGLVYFAFMAGWLNVFLVLGHSSAIETLTGFAAVAIGLVHVKDFFAFGRGPSLSIPESAKPGIYARARRIVYADRLLPALVGAILLAGLVNMIELLCTAGLPAVYTHTLAGYELPAWQHYSYLALYNVFYMLDDAVVLATAVVTLRRFKLAERGGRWLKLLSGTTILALGGWMLAA